MKLHGRSTVLALALLLAPILVTPLVAGPLSEGVESAIDGSLVLAVDATNSSTGSTSGVSNPFGSVPAMFSLVTEQNDSGTISYQVTIVQIQQGLAMLQLRILVQGPGGVGLVEGCSNHIGLYETNGSPVGNYSLASKTWSASAHLLVSGDFWSWSCGGTPLSSGYWFQIYLGSGAAPVTLDTIP